MDWPCFETRWTAFAWLLKAEWEVNVNEQAVRGRPPRYAPPAAPISSPVAPKRIAPPSRRQRSNSFPRPTHSHAHRWSRLTRQHGGEQSGLVTLTLKVVSESCATWATSVPILVIGLSFLDLGPCTRQTDRRQTQTARCQTASSMFPRNIVG